MIGIAARSKLATIALLAVVVHAPDANAAELADGQAKAFLNARSCNACHAIDEMRLGPSFRMVALRYKGADTTKVDWLAHKIILGGAGSWGFVPMVGNPRVSVEEARAVARWILRLENPIPAR